MDLQKKVKTALTRYFKPIFVDVTDDDGVIGVVVSDRFRAVESIDRQTLIQDALNKSVTPFSPEELRRVLAITPMTPEEYVAYSPKNGSRKKRAERSLG